VLFANTSNSSHTIKKFGVQKPGGPQGFGRSS
jgi:hypothetical protein